MIRCVFAKLCLRKVGSQLHLFNSIQAIKSVKSIQVSRTLQPAREKKERKYKHLYHPLFHLVAWAPRRPTRFFPVTASNTDVPLAILNLDSTLRHFSHPKTALRGGLCDHDDARQTEYIDWPPLFCPSFTMKKQQCRK